MRTLVINELAEAAGLDVGRMKVLRHQETDAETGRTSWDLWHEGREKFELHQSLYNSTKSIGNSGHIVSLLASAPRKAVFAGVWEVLCQKDCPSEVVDPLTKRTKRYYYELRSHDLLRDYYGRMIVDWPSGRAWHRRLSSVNISILEIHEEGWDVQPFPGFNKFTILISEAEEVPATWKEVLRAVNGIYLLVDTQDGKQYVGSASGEGGLYQRLSSYVRDRHGGNEGLRLREGRDYKFVILETLGSHADHGELLERESHWKTALGSREHGLNLN